MPTTVDPILHPSSPSWADQCRALARDIKLSHTLFALPWALLATFLAAGRLPHHLPYIGQIILILLCMVTARTLAMSANRLLDAKLDAMNPRTRGRGIPAGRLTQPFVLAAIGVCALAFIITTCGFWWWYANPWPVILSVPVLIFLGAYPLLKRFTRLCHYYLGMALALAPICAWIAVSGTLGWPPVIMAAAVLSWTAGFDILYACQDYESDLQTGIFSVPAKVGIPRALWIARLTHLFSAAMMVVLGLVSPELQVLYLVGVGAAAILLIVEHLLVRPTDLSRLNLAFFTLNGVISVLLATLGILDIYL